MSYLEKAKEWEAQRKRQAAAQPERQQESSKVIDFQKEMQKRRDIFPYPLNETLGIGEWDPLDIKYVNGKPVLQPGWWRKIPKDDGDDGRGKE